MGVLEGNKADNNNGQVNLHAHNYNTYRYIELKLFNLLLNM